MSEVHHALARVRARLIADLPNRLATIRTAAVTFHAQPEKARAEAFRAAHNMTGSAGTVGLETIRNAAGALAHRIENANPSEILALASWPELTTLEEVCRKAAADEP